MKVTVDVNDKLPKQKANSLHETFQVFSQKCVNLRQYDNSLYANVEDLSTE